VNLGDGLTLGWSPTEFMSDLQGRGCALFLKFVPPKVPLESATQETGMNRGADSVPSRVAHSGQYVEHMQPIILAPVCRQMGPWRSDYLAGSLTG